MTKQHTEACRRIANKLDDFQGAICAINYGIVLECVPRYLAKLPMIAAIPCWLVFSILWVGIAGPLTLAAYIILVFLQAVLAPFTTTITPGQLLATVCNVLLALGYFIVLRFCGCGWALMGTLEERATAT